MAVVGYLFAAAAVLARIVVVVLARIEALVDVGVEQIAWRMIVALFEEE